MTREEQAIKAAIAAERSRCLAIVKMAFSMKVDEVLKITCILEDIAHQIESEDKE